jgi:hypothetical protein
MQVWYLICSYVGSGFAGLVSLDIFSSSELPLIARKLSKPDDGHYRPKNVVFHC